MSKLWTKEFRDKLDHDIALWDKNTCHALGRQFDEKVWVKAVLQKISQYEALPKNVYLAVDWALEELENDKTSSSDS